MALLQQAAFSWKATLLDLYTHLRFAVLCIFLSTAVKLEKKIYTVNDSEVACGLIPSPR